MVFDTTEQDNKIQIWKNTHSCKLRTDEHGMKDEIYVGAIGGALTYEFTPTGLGTITVIRCACSEKLDLTNTDEW